MNSPSPINNFTAEQLSDHVGGLFCLWGKARAVHNCIYTVGGNDNSCVYTVIHSLAGDVYGNLIIRRAFLPRCIMQIYKEIPKALTKLCKLCILYTYSSNEINSEHSLDTEQEKDNNTQRRNRHERQDRKDAQPVYS